jgi:hypothetical protein
LHTTLGPDDGRELLDHLGFLLVPGPPLVVGRSYLFVAIRPEPTLRHFDPERIDYWVTPTGHGMPASVEWATREPLAGEHSWGSIRVVDRVSVANEFATFGGELLIARLAEAKICVFSSDAPIVACGGHSQDWAPGARDMYGFLARLRAAADPRGPLEAMIAGLSPVARYAGFVADSLERARRSEEQVGWTRDSRLVLERERSRLKAQASDEWAAGVELLARFGSNWPKALE